MPKVRICNSKRLTERELEKIWNEEWESEGEEFESLTDEDDSDMEPEIIEKVGDVISAESINENQQMELVDAEGEEGSHNLCYKSKDNTIWSKMPCSRSRRTVANIIKAKPGLNGYSSHFTTEIVFQCIFY